MIRRNAPPRPFPPLQKKSTRLAVCAAIAALPWIATPAWASELDDLKAQMETMSRRLAELEEKQSRTPVSAPAAVAKPVPLALQTDQQGLPLDPATSGIGLYSSDTTSLRMYGLLEATISRSDHQTPSGGTSSGFQTAWFSGNRLGFDAEHALAAGASLGMPDLKIISKLETEFELPTGNSDTSGVLFNRDAWLGVYSDKLGKITLGRQNTLTRDFTANWGDPYGTSAVTLKEGGYSNVNNFKQLIFYSGSANGTRVNSAIEWKKNWGNHWVSGLGYAFGSGANGGSGDVGTGGSTPGEFTKGTTVAASVAYNQIDLGGNAVMNVNASLDRANVNNLVHKSELFGGNVVYGPFRVNAGYIHYTAEQGIANSAGTRTDNSWTTSVSYSPGQFDYALGYQVMKGRHAGFSASGTTLNPFGDTAGVTATADGSKSTIYGSVMYHLDKQTDLYFAIDHFNVKDGWVVTDALGNGMRFGAGNPYKTQTDFGVGARFKF
ncbi:Outer membrane protein (porin) (plasmid) [Variovorax sp. SRS16]|uniref:porin n=1 Tax=Variovorax sp. SRS16 TaxID=282217 RepID=UPI00131870BA|nr:porin [Variovorax sp. SRS16]VTU45937.1 Outer membrane protein (porin) [Variovorax sp. SRS16]